jgi:two-component system chemotaxis sensor kinase CheA
LASDKLRMALAAKFRVVARDRFTRLRDLIQALEADPSLASASEELLRELHTLKGEARMMGFASINEIAHQAESLMIYAREVGVSASFPMLVVMFIRALDAMLALLDEQPLPAGFDAAQFGASVQALIAARAAEPPQEASDVSSPTLTAVRLSPTDGVGQHSASSESNPGIASVLRQQIGDIRLQKSANEGVRVSAGKLDQLTMLASELTLGHTRGLRLIEAMDATLLGWRSAFPMQRRALLAECPPALLSLLSAWFERELQWFDSLQNISTRLRDNSFDAEAHLGGLEASVRALRLVPLGSMFAQFRRAVLDLAREQGKQAQVLISGDDVELDAEVIDHISEPLIHLARNCVDHGVEAPAERVGRGKHPRAAIQISASRSGAYVEIVIADDGVGLDTEAIRRRAVERGLIEPTTAGALTPQAIWPLIFTPGFSTRTQASDISGRGVGLDVVKQRVEGLGGHVAVDSTSGQGTRLTMAVPVSIAIAPMLVFEVGGQFYGMPSDVIAGVIKVNAGEVQSAGQGLAIVYEEQRILLIDLHPLLEARAPTDPTLIIVILQQQHRYIGLRVSRCVGERQTVQRALDPFIGGLKLINGTAVLDTGDVILILNGAEVMRVAHEGGGASRGRLSGVSDRVVGRRILVVDDSELTRDLVAGFLRGWGYEITEAEDGALALRALAKGQFDLIITDIDMPNMDGFSLLRAVRAAAEVRDVPVIVLSTRGAERDKRTALQLGADGYVVKSALNPVDFKRMISRFVA